MIGQQLVGDPSLAQVQRRRQILQNRIDPLGIRHHLNRLLIARLARRQRECPQ